MIALVKLILIFIGFLATIALFSGFVKPDSVIFWGKDENKTKKTVFKYYGTILIVCFVLTSLIGTPKSSTQVNNGNTTTSKSSVQSTEDKKKQEEQERLKRIKSKQDTYGKLLETGKSYEQMTSDEKTNADGIVSFWDDLDTSFKSKYQSQKDALSINRASYLEAKAEKAESQEEVNKTEINTDNIPKTITSDYKAKFGQVLEANQLDNKLTIKFKITPSATNKLTIDQNGFNVEDLIVNQGADKYDQINYWAVADMTDGSESKVISYTLNKDLIQKIKNKKIFGHQIYSMADNVWILPSLKK